MSSKLRPKKTYVLFPKPKKHASSPEIKLNSKQKAKFFLQELTQFNYFR